MRARIADFIGTLPERDARPGHIGFNEHFRRIIEFANKMEYKEVHLHVDQSNHPEENGTETLIEAVRWLRPDSGVGLKGARPLSGQCMRCQLLLMAKNVFSAW